MPIRRYGRLPVLFWTQVCETLKFVNPIFITQQLLALAFLIGCTFAPNLKTFAGQYFALSA